MMPDDMGFPTDEDLDREVEARIAASGDLDQPAYPYRGVYFVRCGDVVKIGSSNNVLKRFAELGRIIPVPIAPVGWMPCHGDRAALLVAESVLHELFAADRTNGEWFRYSEDLSLFVTVKASLWPSDAESR